MLGRLRCLTGTNCNMVFEAKLAGLKSSLLPDLVARGYTALAIRIGGSAIGFVNGIVVARLSREGRIGDRR